MTGRLPRNALLARLIRGLLAQGYFHVINTALQLATVPVLLSLWGRTEYAAWLTLSALPAYLAIADLGFSQIASNVMTIKVAADDRAGALVVFQSSLALVCAAIGAVLVLAITAVFVLPLNDWLELRQLGSRTATVLVLLSLQVAATLLFGVVCAGYRAEGKFALSVAISATARLLEGLALLLTASLGGDMVIAAATMLACRVAVLIYAARRVLRVAPWLSFGMRHVDRSLALRMFVPSVSFMGFTIGTMLGIQGTTIVLASTIGPVAVVTVSTVRTMCRLGPTAANMVHFTLQPEYSTYYGARNGRAMIQLFRRHLAAIAALTTMYLATGLSLGGMALRHWTRGEVEASWSFIALMMAGCALEMVWMIFQTPLVSINRHKVAGLVYFVGNGVALAVLACGVATWGIDSVAMIYIAVGAVMLWVCMTATSALATELAGRGDRHRDTAEQ
jgi:O-antigen/teichoic acid export membrane protein